MEESLAWTKAHVALSRGGYDGAGASLDRTGSATDWAWIFTWGESPDDHGIVVVDKDLARAWPIRVAPVGGTDLERFVEGYFEEFGIAFDPAVTPADPSPRQLAVARLLTEPGPRLGIVIATCALIVSAARLLIPGMPLWAIVIVALVSAVAVPTLLGVVSTMAHKRLAAAILRQLKAHRYAHLTDACEYLYHHSFHVAGRDSQYARFWAHTTTQVEDVLARNRDELLPARMDTVIRLAKPAA
ncbi:hypothetical protein [Nocardia sp. NPDC051833]|uniref:hypothetical protein n=1 Tax=Nocardia sp. NPDC051833 TaxID=3155674 RepID=UPI003429BA4C